MPTLLLERLECYPVGHQLAQHLPGLRDVAREKGLRVSDPLPQGVRQPLGVQRDNTLEVAKAVELLDQALLPRLLLPEPSQELFHGPRVRDGVHGPLDTVFDQAQLPLDLATAVEVSLLSRAESVQGLVHGGFDDALIQDDVERVQSLLQRADQVIE